MEVIKDLSVSSRYPTFEFTSGFLDDAGNCVEYLVTLGKIEFNFAYGDNLATNPKLALQRWFDSHSLFSKLKQTQSLFLWGDIYVRFSES